jgi:cobalt/nickel transport system permease protein
MSPLALPLFAVHIADGVLPAPLLIVGFAVTILLALFGAWRLRDEDAPRVAVLTAVFFVASLIHVRIPPTSVHLLLNGLIGVILGRHAALAIPVGLLLQAILIGHGGFWALGVNNCVLTLPALLMGSLFSELHRRRWPQRPEVRMGLIGISVLLWLLSAAFSLAWLIRGQDQAISFLLHPLTLGVALTAAAVAAWADRRLDAAPEFALGLVLGELSVLLTLALNTLVLMVADPEAWGTFAPLSFAVHLPIAVVEGVVVGFAVSYLARVKPDLLDGSSPRIDDTRAIMIPHGVDRTA